MTLRRDVIPIGRENAISRSALCRITGLHDREVRRQIAELRAEDDGSNMVIVSSSRRGRGYFRTDNPEDIQQFIAESQHRIQMTTNAIRVARQVLTRIDMRKLYGEGLG